MCPHLLACLQLLRTEWPTAEFHYDVEPRSLSSERHSRNGSKTTLAPEPGRAKQTTLSRHCYKFSVCTCNVLAPCYVRPRHSETSKPTVWKKRHQRIIHELLLAEGPPAPDILCLQEFWLAEPAFKELYVC